ncbi:MAG TPA: alkaline phosphatase family protein [Blastocatellia bacterium]|nr:alkaline phosphatase family protein [Blastocatellia bacterium]
MKRQSLSLLAKKLVLFLLISTLFAAPAEAQRRKPAQPGTPSKVILVSLDGLAYHMWERDTAVRGAKTLRSIAARGVMARGVQQAFPTITPAGHAALWTGAFGDVSGIITSGNPILPRSEHTAFERKSGYDADLLRAEPIWVAAARQGVKVVAHQATQNYPFVDQTTAPGAATPPILVSGYGPGNIERDGVIRPSNVTPADPTEWKPALPRSSLPVRAFKWSIRNITFYGAMVAEQTAARGYTAIFIAADPRGARVRVQPHPTETVPPARRELARYFSQGLQLTAGRKNVPTVAYFRLFELARDGGDFLIYQPYIHELALYDGTVTSMKTIEAALKEAGGFIGNGPGYLYEDGKLGKQVYGGGDGTAERRYLEGMELVIRQLNRLTAWFDKRYAPRLLVDYCPYPDEMDHTWYGLVRPDVTGISPEVARRMQEFRRWGYAAIDTRVALLNSLAGPRGHIIFVSDHGMSPIKKEVSVNIALREAGLLVTNSNNQIDTKRTEAVHLKSCILVNTTDWKDGIVPVEKRKEVVDRAEKALGSVRDPETNQPVFTAFFRPEDYQQKLGIGGPAGGDLYFELAPGYTASDRVTGETVTTLKVPDATHGFLSTRPEMLASFIARGPRLPRGARIATIRSIDVAPLVADLLGIRPPAQSRGKSPFGRIKNVE